MAYEEAILIKIDKTTKKKMSSTQDNWSELIRTFIQKELNKKRNVAKAERLRAKLFRRVKGPDSTAVIREMRDSRYGPNSA
ncbi:MAG: hypothetical protein KGH94_04240 [Candidatus Micrarchaeota archaeon]|nr:hypothetical protein [Candidatus Micrarchaeota archaeon]